MKAKFLFKEAEAKLENGHSKSSVIDFIFRNAKDDAMANRLCNMLIK